MSEKLREWQEVSRTLDVLLENEKEVADYLATRHPENGDVLVYTPLQGMLDRRGDAIRSLENAQKGVAPLSPPQDEEEAAIRAEVDGKIERIMSLDAKNNARLTELGDFYKGKLKANRRTRDTLSAYNEQLQASAELTSGSLFNESK